jgi:alpha-D-ribose 1-methylphosphonate 5-triphosphate synthase subunit PhnL
MVLLTKEECVIVHGGSMSGASSMTAEVFDAAILVTLARTLVADNMRRQEDRVRQLPHMQELVMLSARDIADMMAILGTEIRWIS